MELYYTIDADSVRPYMPDVPVMLPASSWARYNLRKPKLPEHISIKAADCGGFVAARKWAGQYRYTPEQYVDWLHSWSPQWAATMDYCCEDEITTGNRGVVRERQKTTSELAHLFFERFADVPWDWIPTIQGWDVEDYIRHAEEMKPLIDRGVNRVGIGTLCARADNETIKNVCMAVIGVLGNVPIHLWGVKLDFFKSRIAIPNVVSADTASWNGFFYGGHGAWRESGLTKRQYAYFHALPAYADKMDKALNQPKQGALL